MHGNWVFPDLPEIVLETLDALRSAGYAAYLVGGCVRDACLGRKQTDFDLASSATPDEVRRVFAGRRVLPTGEKHGTVTLLVDNNALEITTFRSDSAYSDGRHPDAVRFTRAVGEDLSRRDFTVNAMAWNPWEGLIDPMGGQADCVSRVLRAVGVPALRFREDALRILRALRFACQLGFIVEPDTLAAMETEAGGLARVSFERVAAECNRALLGEYAAWALRQYPRVLFHALPELEPMLHTPQRIRFHAYDVWEHTLRVLDATPRDLALRWAALFHDSGKPAFISYDPDGTTHFRGHQVESARLAQAALTRLRQPSALREEVHTLVLRHDDRVGPDNLRRLIGLLGENLLIRLLQLQRADLAGKAPDVASGAPRLDALMAQVRHLVREGAATRVRDLAVDGNDLLALGFLPGPALGAALERLLRAVLAGRLDNEREAQLRAARDILEQSESGKA